MSVSLTNADLARIDAALSRPPSKEELDAEAKYWRKQIQLLLDACDRCTMITGEDLRIVINAR